MCESLEMLNDSTRKTAFNSKWLFKVILGHLFRYRYKPIGDYILRHNNFGITREISKDITTTGSKNGNFRRHRSHLMPPIQRTPMNIGITPIHTKSLRYVSAAGWVYLDLHSNFSDGLRKAGA